MQEFIATFADESSTNHAISGTEIIRCERCFWFNGEGCQRAEGLQECRPRDFCSYGEKKSEKICYTCQHVGTGCSAHGPGGTCKNWEAQ